MNAPFHNRDQEEEMEQNLEALGGCIKVANVAAAIILTVIIIAIAYAATL